MFNVFEMQLSQKQKVQGVKAVLGSSNHYIPYKCYWAFCWQFKWAEVEVWNDCNLNQHEESSRMLCTIIVTSFA